MSSGTAAPRSSWLARRASPRMSCCSSMGVFWCIIHVCHLGMWRCSTGASFSQEAGGRCPQILPDSGCVLTVIVCRWYKQVVQGDCDTPQPGVWNIEARAKWNGWNKMKGLAADDCRVRYLDQLSAKVPKDWINWPQLDKLKAELVCLPTPPFPPSPSALAACSCRDCSCVHQPKAEAVRETADVCRRKWRGVTQKHCLTLVALASSASSFANPATCPSHEKSRRAKRRELAQPTSKALVRL